MHLEFLIFYINIKPECDTAINDALFNKLLFPDNKKVDRSIINDFRNELLDNFLENVREERCY